MPTDMGSCHLGGLEQAFSAGLLRDLSPHPAALVSHREPLLQDSPSKIIHLAQAGHRGWSGCILQSLVPQICTRIQLQSQARRSRARN